MIEIGKTLCSHDLIEKQFVCDLNACKGACCVEGDAGAPLEADEVAILEEIYPKVKPYLNEAGIQAIEAQGTSIKDDWDGEMVTPLVNNAECAYTIFNKEGMALCGIEQAYRDGVVDWPKPVSCHLYPVRIKSYQNFDAVNYDRWEICSDACSLGEALKIPVHRFTKDGLVRKYGLEWWETLDAVYKKVESEKNDK
jgi:hypothetical protein